ncbi:MAG: dynamin family protein [Nitrospirota bacterium]
MTGGDLIAHLAKLSQVLEAMGPSFSGIAGRAEELRVRLDEARLRLAVLGQFKRGKSSLLNALLGEPILPTGVLPLTALPTFLRRGSERLVRVTLAHGWCKRVTGSVETLSQVLAHYATEQGNPGNRLGVAQVEVEHPGSLLADGVEIVDTPGIGSTVLQNTRTAKAVLPACDAAIFVLSPDPPITEVEVEFLRSVKEAAAKTVFVVNKADRLSPADRQELVTFLRRVLHEQAGFSQEEVLFFISAQMALQGQATRDEAIRRQSGIGELSTYLKEFLLTGKRTVLEEATRRKGARLIREALFAFDLRQKAAELPRRELERRSERFDAHLTRMTLERTYLRDRVAGDRRRVLEQVDRRAEELARRLREGLTSYVERTRERAGRGLGPKRLHRLIKTALAEEVERVFKGAEGELTAEAQAMVRSIEEAHCREIEGLLHRVRQTAADLFEVPCLEGVVLDRLEAHREARIATQRWVTSFGEEASSWLVGFLPQSLQAARLDRRLREELDYLVARNIEDLRWALVQNAQDAFRLFQERIVTQLDSAVETIRTAIRTVLTRQADREAEQATDLERLARDRQSLERLLSTLMPGHRADADGNPL